jgi:hypothetical protein
VTTTPHPDQVLGALKQKTKRSDKVRSLDVLHSVCGEIHASGGVNYTYALVGRMSERQGGGCVHHALLQGQRGLSNADQRLGGPRQGARPQSPSEATVGHR